LKKRRYRRILNGLELEKSLLTEIFENPYPSILIEALKAHNSLEKSLIPNISDRPQSTILKEKFQLTGKPHPTMGLEKESFEVNLNF